MERSTSIKNLSAALLTFHVKIETIKFDSVNPFFKSKYASLTHILETIKDPLIECGLVIVQLPVDNNGLTTMLIHAESGEFIASTYFMNAEKNTPQAHGSVVSYQRRYCIQSILNLSFDEDDDANLATHGASTPDAVKKEEKQWLNESDPLFEKAKEKLKNGLTTIEKIKSVYKVSKKVEEKLLGVISNPVA